MWKEAVLLALACILFVNMGLSDAIQETLGFRSRILSCPKCLTFWTILVFLLFSGCRVLTAVVASFLFSYLVLWLDLLLTALNKLYNEISEQITAEAADVPDEGPERPEEDSAGVSEVQKEVKGNGNPL